MHQWKIRPSKTREGFLFPLLGFVLTHFELEQQIVPVKGQKLQPKGHLLSFSPVNPTAKGDVMAEARQLGYTPLSNRQNGGWKTFEDKCGWTRSLHHYFFFKIEKSERWRYLLWSQKTTTVCTANRACLKVLILKQNCGNRVDLNGLFCICIF